MEGSFLTAEEIKAARKRRKIAEAILESRHLPNQPEIECGCCYVEYPPTKITQCPDGHLFCLDCAKRSAQNVIGLRKTELKCISTDSCNFDFSVSEIARFLPEKEFKAYEVMLQEKEIAKAKLEGFVQCPFCPFGIIGNPEGTIFRCLNTEICGVDSCVKCKRKAHGKNPCEAESSAANLIAEAMTEALMRECPGCHTKFFKVEGCNKMTCTCGVKMCYVCRKRIEGYEHFQQGVGSCKLHDDTNARNKNDAVQAGEAKLAELGLKGTTAEKLLDGSTFKTVREPNTAPRLPPGVNNSLNDLRNQVRQAEIQFTHYHDRYLANQERITSINDDLMNVNNALFAVMERLQQRLILDIPRMIAAVEARFPNQIPAIAVERARLRVLMNRFDAFYQQKADFEKPLRAKEKERLQALAAERIARNAAQREERKRKAAERVAAVHQEFERMDEIAVQARANAVRGRSTRNSQKSPNIPATSKPIPKRKMTLDDYSPSEADKRLNAARIRNEIHVDNIPSSSAQMILPANSLAAPPPLFTNTGAKKIYWGPNMKAATGKLKLDAVIEIPGPSATSREKSNQPGPSGAKPNKQQVIFISETPVKRTPHIIDLTGSR